MCTILYIIRVLNLWIQIHFRRRDLNPEFTPFLERTCPEGHLMLLVCISLSTLYQPDLTTASDVWKCRDLHCRSTRGWAACSLNFSGARPGQLAFPKLLSSKLREALFWKHVIVEMDFWIEKATRWFRHGSNSGPKTLGWESYQRWASSICFRCFRATRHLQIWAMRAILTGSLELVLKKLTLANEQQLHDGRSQSWQVGTYRGYPILRRRTMLLNDV